MHIGKSGKKIAAGLFLLLSFTGCGGGGGSTVTPTQTINWQLDGKGNMQFSTNDPQWYGYSFWSYFNQSYQTQMSTVTAVVEKVSGASGSGFGINFCYQDNNNFYVLAIDAYGHYTVYSNVAGTYTTIIPWTAPTSAVINKGFGVQNEISVTETTANNFTIYFNGTPETQFSDPNFVGGKAGFHISVSTAGNENFPNVSEDVRFRMTAPLVYPATAGAAASMLREPDSSSAAALEPGEMQEVAR